MSSQQGEASARQDVPGDGRPAQAAAAEPQPAQAAAPEPQPAQTAAPELRFDVPVAAEPRPAPGPEPGAPSAPGSGGAAGFGQLPGAKSPWKPTADGKTVFRRGTPFVIFWAWVAFAIFNLIQVVIPGHDYFSLELLFGLLALTGLAYASALRPRVIADDDAIVVHNPFRDHLIRWGAVEGIYLGDSVEISCKRPAPKKEKTVYCWALYSGRRSRLRAQQRSNWSQRRESRRGLPQALGRTGLPAEAEELAKKDAVELMAAELGRRSTQGHDRGVPDAVLENRWAWLPLASTLVPAAVLVGLLLAR